MSRKGSPESIGVPMRLVGPVKIAGSEFELETLVPLATYEEPLWPSVNRGARVSVLSGGLQAVVVDERMSRSILLEAPSAGEAAAAAAELPDLREELNRITAEGSRYARLIGLHTQVVANLLYIRFEFETGDAAGHNMVTAASEQLMNWLLQRLPALRYVSLSGNFCTDKKVSAVNGILGRGRHVIVEAIIPDRIVRRYLKTTPAQIVNLNLKKNLLGSILAGGVRSANAHFANILLGFYLATGQDAANLVEGSQGFVHTESREGADGVSDLYFSVTVPHVIIGSVGAGKNRPAVRKNLELLGCLEERPPGENARRLAVIAGAAVWCGELSLLAALTNPGELMQAHTRMERS